MGNIMLWKKRSRLFHLQFTQAMTEYRIERDSFGELQVPADKYWGAQTQRYASMQSLLAQGVW